MLNSSPMSRNMPTEFFSPGYPSLSLLRGFKSKGLTNLVNLGNMTSLTYSVSNPTKQQGDILKIVKTIVVRIRVGCCLDLDDL